MSKILSLYNTSAQERAQIRKQLRQTLRAKRRTLSESAQLHSALTIQHSALKLVQQKNASHIALYLPFKGEISTYPLIETLQQQGKSCLLPVLHPFSPHYLQFFRHTDNAMLIKNRFGIAEPRLDVRHIVPFDEIEIIFVPLVACDKHNQRLGMGGGFYDRTLAQMPKAYKVGLAYDFQQIENLPCEPWDVPLDHILLG